MRKFSSLLAIFFLLAVTGKFVSADTIAAGVLPYFKDKTVLLGKEYRQRYGTYKWMEFGGVQDQGETLAQTASREANEETAGTLAKHITLERVQQAEKDGHYVDHFNDKTKVFYRMYFISIPDPKPSIESFRENARNLGSNSNVEKVDWKYFPVSVILEASNQSSQDINLPGTEESLYETTKVRLAKPETRKFFESLK